MSNPVVAEFFNSTQEALLTGAERIFENAKSTTAEKEAILSSIVFFRRFHRFVRHAFEDGKFSKEQFDELTKSGKKSFLGGIF